MNPRFIDGDTSILFERGGTLFVTFRNSIGVNGAISVPKQPEKFLWPWISPDGTRIYYHATDRPGGLGKDDLWLIRRVSKPRL